MPVTHDVSSAAALRVQRSSERRSWLIAWVLALAFHAGLIPVLRSVRPLKAPSTVHRLEPVRLVFQKPGPEARRSQAPHVFTELPPDRADAKPRQADFLSNVTSRARDLVPGGDDAMPRMQGEVDAPMVKLEPGGDPSRPSTTTPPAPQMTAPTPAPQSSQPADAQGGATGHPAAPAPSAPAVPPPTGTAPRGPLRAGGYSDIYQPQMDNPGGNAAPTGDVSLNTTAWDYAPWLQRFGRQLMRRWIPPPAYSFGILKEGGWAVFEMEITPAGKVLRLDQLEEHGHPSLILAAHGALDSMSPIEPLPADFPEPTLILRIRMIYPKVYSR